MKVRSENNDKSEFETIDEIEISDQAQNADFKKQLSIP